VRIRLRHPGDVGLYNILRDVEVCCPRCGATGSADVEFYLGEQRLNDYRVGDRIEWRNGTEPAERRGQWTRPEGGSIAGEGYAECPTCGRDFFLTIDVTDDLITGVRVDSARPGFIPDDEPRDSS
jgi:hypothetical protein